MSLLKATLDRYAGSFPYRLGLAKDPVQHVHRYSDPHDREVVAIFAAALAYGNVVQILNTLKELFQIMGDHPYRYVLKFSATDRESIRHFYHRFNTGTDVAALCLALQLTFREFDSLQDLFLSGHRSKAITIESGLSFFVENLLARVPAEIYRSDELPRNAGVRFLLSSPRSGSACKRMNLFLRWMVRPAPVDFRQWKAVRPNQLVLPVDTHIARIGRYIGLTSRKNIGWRMALEMTETLRRLDPLDPIRYDFALCHLGIMRGCPAHFNPLKCQACPIREICTL